MRRVLIILFAFVAVVAAAIAVLYFTGTIVIAVAWLFQPKHGWDVALKAPAPDYTHDDAWAALPSRAGLARLVPAGVSPGPSDPPVDVFFVHPTGYMSGEDWNSPLNKEGVAEQNTQWMLANQASAFNGCCAIYAPRYREASIFTYFTASPDIFKKTMDLAYGDVDRAFSYFLAHYSHGRPFILASHSQGTGHAFRLIKERIDGTPLADRMVAAYLIGGDITDKRVDALKTVHACNGPVDFHCVIHWATWGDGGSPRTSGDKLLCVNPLTWKRDGGMAPKSLHQGGVPPTGRFQFRPWSDAPGTVAFGPLKSAVRTWTWAECRHGILTVAAQDEGPFAGLDLGRRNYHGLDYPLFHMDIRENAPVRVAAYTHAVQARADETERSRPLPLKLVSPPKLEPTTIWDPTPVPTPPERH